MKLYAPCKALAATLLIILSACDGADPKKSARGFRLPDGDIEEGKVAFVALDCHQCHSVVGVELAKYEGDSPVSLSIGGEVRRVKNYGELVTSIINPDHVISTKYLTQLSVNKRDEAKAKSPMHSSNDKMTVTQLIDIVAFLQSRYEEAVPEYDTDYYP